MNQAQHQASSPATIEKLELFPVAPRWLFLKITTSDGGWGWGEPIVEGKAETVAACVREMSDALLGHRADRIEDIFQLLHRGGFYRGGPVVTSAISGIEQALWDARGRRLGLPVHELLGGAVRDRMKVYAWVGGDSAEKIAVQGRERVGQGYTALKMNATQQAEWIDTPALVDGVLERTVALREAVGPKVGIALDFHGRIHRAMAKVLLRELEPLRLMWVEEPVGHEQPEALREVARFSTVPIATGERLFTRWGFRDLLSGGGVDVVQPDISHAGGIWEIRKIAAMAEAYDVALAIHCPLGPIAFAAAMQVNFCTPNALIQEQTLGIGYHGTSDQLDYLADPNVFRFENGFIERLTAPGLGIEINEEKVREAARTGHRWRNPTWRYPDGSVAEW